MSNSGLKNFSAFLYFATNHPFEGQKFGIIVYETHVVVQA